MIKTYRVDIVHSNILNILHISISNHILQKTFEQYGITVLPYVNGKMYIHCDANLLGEFLMNYVVDISLQFSVTECDYPERIINQNMC